MATELQTEIKRLRTLQESQSALIDSLETFSTTIGGLQDLEPDLRAGKQAVAAAIRMKDVQMSDNATLAQMAEGIRTISQQPIIMNDGDLAHMYSKQLYGVQSNSVTPGYWNLYEIMAQLLSDGRLVNYGGILLAEYYKGYDSLALSGAGAGGAYVVSDKDANGNFIMYTNDTTHVWDTEDDGKGNRWVAYCFADAGHNFDITDTDTSPRSIHIGRSVGTITSLVNGRASEIVVQDGSTLDCFDSADYTQNFGRVLVLRNLQNQTAPINPAASTDLIYLNSKDILSSEAAPLFKENNASCIIISCDSFNGQLFPQRSCDSLKSLYISCLSDETKSTIHMGKYNTYWSARNLKNLIITSEYCTFVNYPDSSGYFTNLRVLLNYVSNDKTKLVTLGNRGFADVQFVEIQNGWCKPLNISVCTNLTEANIYSHILQRLKQDEPDCGQGVTITLGATNLAKLTSDESVALLQSLTDTYKYVFD